MLMRQVLVAALSLLINEIFRLMRVAVYLENSQGDKEVAYIDWIDSPEACNIRLKDISAAVAWNFRSLASGVFEDGKPAICRSMCSMNMLLNRISL